MTLARYTAVVLGAVGASLCAAWPFLPAESRLAVLTGALLAAANTVCAYFLAVWSAGDDPAFTRRLGAAGFKVSIEKVRARSNGKGAQHTIWLAESSR